jgi:hypothetical protein
MLDPDLDAVLHQTAAREDIQGILGTSSADDAYQQIVNESQGYYTRDGVKVAILKPLDVQREELLETSKHFNTELAAYAGVKVSEDNQSIVLTRYYLPDPDRILRIKETGKNGQKLSPEADHFVDRLDKIMTARVEAFQTILDSLRLMAVAPASSENTNITEVSGEVCQGLWSKLVRLSCDTPELTTEVARELGIDVPQEVIKEIEQRRSSDHRFELGIESRLDELTTDSLMAVAGTERASTLSVQERIGIAHRIANTPWHGVVSPFSGMIFDTHRFEAARVAEQHGEQLTLSHVHPLSTFEGSYNSEIEGTSAQYTPEDFVEYLQSKDLAQMAADGVQHFESQEAYNRKVLSAFAEYARSLSTLSSKEEQCRFLDQPLPKELRGEFSVFVGSEHLPEWVEPNSEVRIQRVVGAIELYTERYREQLERAVGLKAFYQDLQNYLEEAGECLFTEKREETIFRMLLHPDDSQLRRVGAFSESETDAKTHFKFQLCGNRGDELPQLISLIENPCGRYIVNNSMTHPNTDTISISGEMSERRTFRSYRICQRIDDDLEILGLDDMKTRPPYHYLKMEDQISYGLILKDHSNGRWYQLIPQERWQRSARQNLLAGKSPLADLKEAVEQGFLPIEIEERVIDGEQFLLRTIQIPRTLASEEQYQLADRLGEAGFEPHQIQGILDTLWHCRKIDRLASSLTVEEREIVAFREQARESLEVTGLIRDYTFTSSPEFRYAITVALESTTNEEEIRTIREGVRRKALEIEAAPTPEDRIRMLFDIALEVYESRGER